MREKPKVVIYGKTYEANIEAWRLPIGFLRQETFCAAVKQITGTVEGTLMRAEDAAMEDWISSRPPHVQAVIRRFPPDANYRIKGDRLGHYQIISYCEYACDCGETKTVAVKLEHLPDSTMPGTEVFGVDPDFLIAC